MDTTQQNVSDVVVAGHNVCVVGQPGTGKTQLLLKLSAVLKAQGKRVTLTASTGIASVSIGGTTIHKFSGIGDGTLTIEQVLQKLRDSGRHENIKATDVLFIDEISMLSAKTFLDIEEVFRRSRGINRPFGGIQVVVFGDFYQLKPVPSIHDPGYLLIQNASIFKDLVPHHYVLRHVYRQSNGPFIQTIHSLCRGIVTPAVEAFVSSLDKEEVPNSTKLFARNLDVDIANLQGLSLIKGEVKQYLSSDHGDVSRLKNFTVPRRLQLKVGCPVVLISNISETLVNGMRGTVVVAEDTTIIVTFQNLQTITMEPYSFMLKDRNGTVIAWRKQYPLKACFGFTVHRAQGMTIDRLHINAKNMNNPGQLGVALGRARSAESVSVSNFNAKDIRKQPVFIDQYYCSESIVPASDLLCCQSPTVSTPTTETSGTNTASSSTQPASTPNDEPESDEETPATDFTALDAVVLNSLQTVKYPSALTPNQTDVNTAIEFLVDVERRERRMKFIGKVWRELSIIFDAKLGATILTNSDSSSFYRAIHTFTGSTLFKRMVVKLFSGCTLLNNDMFYRVAYSITEQLRKEKLQAAVENIKVVTSNVDTIEPDKHTRDTVRYIGGWCIAKLIYNKRQLIRRYIENLASLPLIEAVNREIEILEDMTIDLDPENETMEKILRKEYRSNALTVINDSLLEFFLALDDRIQTNENMENVSAHRGNLYIHIGGEIVSDDTLKNLWRQSSGSDDVDILYEVYQKYIVLSASQYSKKLKASLNIKRTFTLRKEVHRSSEKKAKTIEFPCGQCGKECVSRVVQCETCYKWFHFRCIGLKGKEPELDDAAPPWRCEMSKVNIKAPCLVG